MRRRHRLQLKGREHLDRWLISYADYMTLIFALFVVLYSVAVVDKEKYRSVIDGLSQAFSQQQPPSNGLLDGVGSHLLDSASAAAPATLLDSATTSQAPDSIIMQRQDGASLAEIDAQLGLAVGALVEAGLVKINRDDEWLTIELSAGLLFASGSATLGRNAPDVIAAVSRILKPVDNYIRVRGYTDNQQINNEIFHSNWQLSAARAGAVLESLMALGIDPHRLAMEAYGEFSPWSDNRSEQGRAQNRKVVIALSRYAWVAPLAERQVKENTSATEPMVPVTEPNEQDIKVITLPSGGIRITTRKEP
ncbi:flagellar motor protein MotB [Aeromonas simiae]|uniref:flagellar motor protein MotB n=1 Tax=Aeromonas simiae TaxID=218936 RepID=UPI0005AA3277|nr:flagellar motor protein MotB [Aeromonas simiae]MDO2947259.1 OmpA family protein [Aeromonas simiae]MDO2950854.1 OmpA family protein [Aeromonas simiae]MDO2954785.1 OmpA family protein [Aeromonas simiae]